MSQCQKTLETAQDQVTVRRQLVALPVDPTWGCGSSENVSPDRIYMVLKQLWQCIMWRNEKWRIW